MTATAIVAAAILELMRIGGAADYHAAAILRASDSAETAAKLAVLDFRESRFSWDVERCHKWSGDGRGAFQLESGWGSLVTRCGALSVQAGRAVDAISDAACGDSAFCQFQSYSGRGLHVREVAERNGLFFVTLRRIEEKACVLP